MENHQHHLFSCRREEPDGGEGSTADEGARAAMVLLCKLVSVFG